MLGQIFVARSTNLSDISRGGALGLKSSRIILCYNVNVDMY